MSVSVVAFELVWLSLSLLACLIAVICDATCIHVNFLFVLRRSAAFDQVPWRNENCKRISKGKERKRMIAPKYGIEHSTPV